MKLAYPRELFVDPVAWRKTWSGRRSRILVTKAQARQDREEKILDTLTELSRRRKKKGRITGMPEEYAIKLAKLPDRMAAIAGKTFAIRGAQAFDEEKGGLADDQAVSMFVDLLNELDPTIIERNKNKRLASPLRRAS